MANNENIHVIVTITPAPGLRARVGEVLMEYAKKVEQTEPDTLQCQMFTYEDTGEFYFEECFKNAEALANHRSLPNHLQLEENLKEHSALAKPMEIRILRPVSGFSAR